MMAYTFSNLYIVDKNDTNRRIFRQTIVLSKLTILFSIIIALHDDKSSKMGNWFLDLRHTKQIKIFRI
jgi:hypothetical protein